MGGCWPDDGAEAKRLAARIDRGEGLGEDEACWDVDHQADQAVIALSRVLRHQQRLREVNPMGAAAFDQPLRCALTRLVRNTPCPPPAASAAGLRYLRDRISVPRDMPLPAARLLRQALEATAQLDGPEQAKPLPVRDRFDQDPQRHQGHSGPDQKPQSHQDHADDGPGAGKTPLREPAAGQVQQKGDQSSGEE